MKICLNCNNCYDDSENICECASNTELKFIEDRDRLMVAGYSILKRLKSVSNGELYLARQIASGKTVEIAIVAPDSSNELLFDELERIALADSAFVSRLIEFGVFTDSEIFVVSEYSNETTLRDRLSNGVPLSERESIRLARAISEALESLHSIGLVHRNLHPENILIVDSSNAVDAKVSAQLRGIDFGGVSQRRVAAEANGLEASPELFRYFSPEQISNESVDFRSDIFGFGVLFYEMLFAHSPFLSLSPSAIREFTFNENDTNGLDHDLRALIVYTLRETLQRRPEARIRSAAALSRQLRHLEFVSETKFSKFDGSATQELGVDRTHNLGVETNPAIDAEKNNPVVIKDEAIYDQAELEMVQPRKIEFSDALRATDFDEVYFEAPDTRIEPIEDFELIDSMYSVDDGLPVVEHQESKRSWMPVIAIGVAGAFLISMIGFGAYFVVSSADNRNDAAAAEAKPKPIESETEQIQPVADESNTGFSGNFSPPISIPERVNEEKASSPAPAGERMITQTKKSRESSPSEPEKSPALSTKKEIAAGQASTENKRKPNLSVSPIRNSAGKKVDEKTVIIVGNKGNSSKKQRPSTSPSPSFPPVVITY